MADEITTPEAQPKKPKKVSIILTRATNANVEGVVIRKGDILELEAAKADKFLATGLFERK